MPHSFAVVAVVFFVVLVAAVLAFARARRRSEGRPPPAPDLLLPLTGVSIADQASSLRSALTFEQIVALGASG